MNWRKLSVALLLPLYFCINTEETVVKSAGKASAMTPVCPNATLETITLIVCKIRKGGGSGEGCLLLYRHEEGFENKCGSEFMLIPENRSVFLRLTGLTLEHYGNYTCECSHVNGMHVLHLQITGEAKASRSSLRTLADTAVVSTAAGFFLIAGLLLGLGLKKSHCRANTRSSPFGPSGSRTTHSSDKGEQEGVYTSLQEPAADLYQTTSSMSHERAANDRMSLNSARKAVIVSLKQELNREIHQDGDIYENM